MEELKKQKLLFVKNLLNLLLVKKLYGHGQKNIDMLRKTCQYILKNDA